LRCKKASVRRPAAHLTGCLAALSIGTTGARAQDVEPRALTPAPVGTNVLGGALGYSWGEVVLDKSVPVKDLDGSLLSLVPSYTRFIDLFGTTGRLTVALPAATGSWDFFLGQDSVETTNSQTGFGDPVASMMVFLVGAPSMTRADFRDYRRKTIVGFNLRLRVPIGQYDSSKLINLGANRWQIAPALAVAQHLGNWDFSAYAAAWFFTDNTSFFPGENVLSQNPLYAFQLNAAYTFRPRLWLALGARQSFGGRPSTNGVDAGERQDNTRIGVVLGVPIARRHTVKLIGTSGPSTTLGNDFNTVVLQWFYAW
jgi:hypothetical protein